MVQSPSGEANWFAASQEIPRISRNLKFHYRTHKRPLLCKLRDASPRNTPRRRSEWGSCLPPDCFAFRGIIPHVSVS